MRRGMADTAGDSSTDDSDFEDVPIIECDNASIESKEGKESLNELELPSTSTSTYKKPRLELTFSVVVADEISQEVRT